MSICGHMVSYQTNFMMELSQIAIFLPYQKSVMHTLIKQMRLEGTSSCTTFMLPCVLYLQTFPRYTSVTHFSSSLKI